MSVARHATVTADTIRPMDGDADANDEDRVNLETDEPLTDQLERILRRRIAGGRLTGKLPGESQLMAEHQISRVAVRRALERLERDRLIYGATLPPPSRPLLARARRQQALATYRRHPTLDIGRYLAPACARPSAIPATQGTVSRTPHSTGRSGTTRQPLRQRASRASLDTTTRAIRLWQLDRMREQEEAMGCPH